MARPACAHCGEPLNAGERFCVFCGTPVPPAPDSTSTPAGPSTYGGPSEAPPPPPLPAWTETPGPQGQVAAAPQKRAGGLLWIGCLLGMALLCAACLGGAALAAPYVTPFSETYPFRTRPNGVRFLLRRGLPAVPLLVLRSLRRRDFRWNSP